MNMGLIVCYGAMILITASLIQSLSTILEAPSVSIVLPGVDVPGSPIYVPFGYGFIGLITVIIVHEFSHGIISRCEGIKIESIGLLLFAILPGAFVEPNEKELKESSKLSRLRVYGAGSMANIVLAIISLLIVAGIGNMVVPHTFSEDGIEISRVVEGSPASKVLKEGMIIESIDNKTFNSSNDYINLVSNLEPNQSIVMQTDQGSYTIVLSQNPNNDSRGYIGVQASKHFVINDDVKDTWGDNLPWIWFILLYLFQWIAILNLGIGLFNLLPVKPLDGGHMFEILLSYKLKENQYQPIVRIVGVVLALVIIFSIVYGFIGGI